MFVPPPTCVNWGIVDAASRAGRLCDAVQGIPQHAWGEANRYTAETLLHYAARHADHKAVLMLVRGGAQVDACDKHGYTPAHVAVIWGRLDTLTLLLGVGAPMSMSMVTLALSYQGGPSARLLVGNGVRLSETTFPPWIVRLERGWVACRAAVVALLCLKRHRAVARLHWIDRFVVRMMALELYTTRQDPAWCAC